MTAGPRPPVPRHVPTLTEVLQPPDSVTPPPPSATALLTDDVEDAELVRRVLVALHQRLDSSLEPRLRAAIAPAAQAITEALLAEARAQIGELLRDAVREAVAAELARRGRSSR
jgi:uncharacterized membrane-anchored protein YjiN (DUF445 family)